MTNSIIHTKLYHKYKSYSNMAKYLGKTTTYRISQGKLPCIYNIAEICKSINYTFAEFKIDYYNNLKKTHLSNYYIVYMIYINGYNLTSYAKKINIHRGTLIHLQAKNFEFIDSLLIWKIKWIINKDKLPFEAQIEFIKKEGYAKIIGNRDTLEKLKELYSIPYPVLYYSNHLWHIAFWWI